jgi:ABC-2 type transport system permease protein
MRKIFIIARWEFIEKIKTRSFVISLILTPLIIVAFSFFPSLLAEEESDRTVVVGILDPSSVFTREMIDKLEDFRIKQDQPAYIMINLYQSGKDITELLKRADSLVVKGSLEGVVIITDSSGSYLLEYRSINAGNLKNTKRIEKAFNEVRIMHHLEQAGVAPDIMSYIFEDSDIRVVRLNLSGKESESSFLEIFFSSLVFIMILVFIILSSGGMLIRSLVEEKSNRLIEILVSSCKPEELLTGKILGLSLLALVQITIWIILGIFLTGIQLIPLSAFDYLLPMLVYFILGFLFYTALFVGIGSVVNTEQEAQQITGYLTLILFLPVIFAVSSIQNPDSWMVNALTYIPFTTPVIMLLKFNIKPVPVHEIFITVSLLVFSIFLVIIITSRIFRIGILSYGKMPAIKKIFQWINEN